MEFARCLELLVTESARVERRFQSSKRAYNTAISSLSNKRQRLLQAAEECGQKKALCDSNMQQFEAALHTAEFNGLRMSERAEGWQRYHVAAKESGKLGDCLQKTEDGFDYTIGCILELQSGTQKTLAALANISRTLVMEREYLLLRMILEAGVDDRIGQELASELLGIAHPVLQRQALQDSLLPFLGARSGAIALPDLAAAAPVAICNTAGWGQVVRVLMQCANAASF